MDSERELSCTQCLSFAMNTYTNACHAHVNVQAFVPVVLVPNCFELDVGDGSVDRLSAACTSSIVTG
jgi:hypothetical protein